MKQYFPQGSSRIISGILVIIFHATCRRARSSAVMEALFYTTVLLSADAYCSPHRDKMDIQTFCLNIVCSQRKIHFLTIRVTAPGTVKHRSNHSGSRECTPQILDTPGVVALYHANMHVFRIMRKLKSRGHFSIAPPWDAKASESIGSHRHDKNVHLQSLRPIPGLGSLFTKNNVQNPAQR